MRLFHQNSWNYASSTLTVGIHTISLIWIMPSIYSSLPPFQINSFSIHSLARMTIVSTQGLLWRLFPFLSLSNISSCWNIILHGMSSKSFPLSLIASLLMPYQHCLLLENWNFRWKSLFWQAQESILLDFRIPLWSQNEHHLIMRKVLLSCVQRIHIPAISTTDLGADFSSMSITCPKQEPRELSMSLLSMHGKHPA